MPPAPSAPAAALASTSRRVRRTSRAPRPHEHEPAQHPVQVPHDLPVRIGANDVLAEGVERATAPPEVEDVPLVDVLVDRVDLGLDAGHVLAPAELAEARDRPAARDARHGLDREAARDGLPSRIAPEVDVDVAALVVREEADQVASIGLDRLAVPPIAAELGVERVRHPRRTVDRRADSVRKPLPPGA